MCVEGNAHPFQPLVPKFYLGTRGREPLVRAGQLPGVSSRPGGSDVREPEVRGLAFPNRVRERGGGGVQPRRNSSRAFSSKTHSWYSSGTAARTKSRYAGIGASGQSLP